MSQTAYLVRFFASLDLIKKMTQSTCVIDRYVSDHDRRLLRACSAEVRHRSETNIRHAATDDRFIHPSRRHSPRRHCSTLRNG